MSDNPFFLVNIVKVCVYSEWVSKQVSKYVRRLTNVVTAEIQYPFKINSNQICKGWVFFEIQEL